MGGTLDSPAMPRSIRALLPLLMLLALAAGCGGSAGASGAKATATPSSAQAVDAVVNGISHRLPQRPRIPTPDGPPPGGLVSRDIVRGSGKPVKAGQAVSVQYVGASWSTGREFDASWNRGQAFGFRIPGQVIEGWNEGILGMRKGGRRLLVIPPVKGYGSQGTPDGSIAPNETLLFVIDLERVR